MTSSSNLITIAATIAALLLGACGGDPCLPTIGVDTIITPPAEDCNGGTSTSTSTTGDTTGDTGVCEPPPFPVDGPTCIAVPDPGAEWGACLADDTCGPGLDCKQGEHGNVCIRPCDDCGCAGDGNCFGGECNGDGIGECVPSCKAAGDACPAGMQCDPGLTICVRPPSAPACVYENGKAWAPCDDGACMDGSMCVTSNGASICQPKCDAPIDQPCGASDDCKDKSSTCNTNGRTPLCGYECGGDYQCGFGQVCSALGLCMWPL